MDSGAMFTDAAFSGSGALHLAPDPIEGCAEQR
jgi:hypothetical protein